MNFFKSIVLAAAVFPLLALASCGRLIYDDAGSGDACRVSVRFKYDYNMKFADAFPNEVHSVTVFVFDPRSGALVTRASDVGKHLDGSYSLSIPGLASGTYDLVAWCGLEDSGFTVNVPATKQELICRLNTLTKASDYLDRDPGALYYGYADKVQLDVLPAGAANNVVIDLIKNTNSVRVMLQALNMGAQLNPDEYDFIISDDNALLDWKDEVSSPVSVDYLPWDKRMGTVEYDDNNNYLSATIAEFTTNRLFKKDKNKVMLAVVDKVTGEKVINIPIVDYFLLVKGNYNRQMGDQEYLDRQDDYQITFFLDNTRGWSIAAGIFINGWHVVLQDTVLD
ncbi:MAG: FimB/Mfa2 family fimbrial subunit [Bacteroidales bacterium]|nr:FimB/Mfa2 family fimbrial subunit [Bacteroidales bacterium]